MEATMSQSEKHSTSEHAHAPNGAVSEPGAAAPVRLLSRDDFKAAPPPKTEDVPAPELGEGAVVRMVTLSSIERDRFEDSLARDVGGGKTKVDRINIRAKLIVKAAVDADGKRLFTDADLPWVSNLPSTLTDRMFTVAMRLAGMSSEAVEDAAKNSDSALSGASSSPSPSNSTVSLVS
jgi:hypothetical protein